MTEDRLRELGFVRVGGLPGWWAREAAESHGHLPMICFRRQTGRLFTVCGYSWGEAWRTARRHMKAKDRFRVKLGAEHQVQKKGGKANER